MTMPYQAMQQPTFGQSTFGQPASRGRMRTRQPQPQVPQQSWPEASTSAPGDNYGADSAPPPEPTPTMARYQGRMAVNRQLPPAPAPVSVVTGQPMGSMGTMAPANQPMVNAMAMPGASGVGQYNPNGAGSSGNAALDATYLGKSKGQQWFIGPDGKQYTNADRERAAAQTGDAIDNDMRAVMAGQLGNQLGLQGGYQTGLGTALGAMDAAGTKLANWAPTNSQRFDASRLESLAPTRNDAQNFDGLTNFRSTATEGVDTGALDSYDPTALRGVNTNALKGYDAAGATQRYLNQTGGYGPSAAPDIQASQNGYNAADSVNTYARGAASQSRFALEEALRAQENSAAAGGRLDTGLFDRDKGLVIQNVGRDLNDKIAQAAVQAAGIQAGIGNNNASLGTQASIARGNLAGNILQNREGLRSSEAINASRIGADTLNNALGLDTQIAGQIDQNRLTAANAGVNARLNKAGTIDSNRLTGLDAGSRLQQSQAQYGDTFRQTNTRDALDMTQRNNNYLDTATLNGLTSSGDFTRGAADLYNTLNQGTFNNINDLAASERDRITADRNVRSAAAAQKNQNKTNLWGAGIGLAGTLAGAAIRGGA